MCARQSTERKVELFPWVQGARFSDYVYTQDAAELPLDEGLNNRNAPVL